MVYKYKYNGDIRMNNNKVKLSPRLQLIANKVLIGSSIADIGTDHAYIPIYLIQNGIAVYAIASDVRQGPVDKANENAKKYQLKHKVDVRLGYGLEMILKDEVDTVIIAGMGGTLISEILTTAASILMHIKRLILQPMTGQDEVREWLAENRFIIIDEELVLEGEKIYNVIVAEHGEERIEKEVFYHIGKKLIDQNDPLLKPLIGKKIKEMKNIIRQLEDKDSDNAYNRLVACKERLSEFKELDKLI